MNMSVANNTSGVDRYIQVLIEGLELLGRFDLYWINFCHDPARRLLKEERKDGYVKTIIPLPEKFNEIIQEKYWMEKYNEQVLRLINHIFDKECNSIIHIHTLNLIELANVLRNKFGCKIITHLHCIPWKSYFNSNRKLFNKLYQDYYFECEKPKTEYITNFCEEKSYKLSDHIICVTDCGKSFLQRIFEIDQPQISVVQNGINYLPRISGLNNRAKEGGFNLLYVGVISESKGLKFILDALKIIVAKKYNVHLNIAGKGSEKIISNLKQEYKNLPISFLGCLPFEELREYYESCDIGILASLQEQSSYVAIEMMQYSLPIITSAVDGLDEMFTDNINALKVDTCFSEIDGLSLDINLMADKIILLMESDELRQKLSKNVEHLYLKKYTLERLIEETVQVYNKFLI